MILFTGPIHNCDYFTLPTIRLYSHVNLVKIETKSHCKKNLIFHSVILRHQSQWKSVLLFFLLIVSYTASGNKSVLNQMANTNIYNEQWTQKSIYSYFLYSRNICCSIYFSSHIKLIKSLNWTLIENAQVNRKRMFACNHSQLFVEAFWSILWYRLKVSQKVTSPTQARQKVKWDNWSNLRSIWNRNLSAIL